MLTLVDPDNRQPVDFDAATARLDEIAALDGSPRQWFDGDAARARESVRDLEAARAAT